MLEYYITQWNVAGPKGGKSKKKYVARLHRMPMLRRDDLAKRVEVNSCVTSPMVQLVWDETLEVTKDMLQSGTPVQIGGLGTIELSLRSKTYDSPDEITFKSIKNVEIIFKPSVELKEILTDLYYTKVINKDLEKE